MEYPVDEKNENFETKWQKEYYIYSHRKQIYKELYVEGTILTLQNRFMFRRGRVSFLFYFLAIAQIKIIFESIFIFFFLGKIQFTN